MSSTLRRQLLAVGWVAATAAAVLTALWVTTLIALPAAPAEAGTGDQLRFIRDSGLAHSAGLVLVLPLAFLLVPVWLGLAAMVWDERPAAGLLAVCFGVLYAPLVSLNYWSQLTVVRGLADLATDDAGAATALFRLFTFDELWSFGYAFNVFGYAVWALAGLSIAVGLWMVTGQLARAAALLFGLTGVLAIIGAAGYALGSSLLELGVLASGITFLASIALAAILLRRSLADVPSSVAVPEGSPP